MIDISKELTFCDECISHLGENATPDHIIVKYRNALVDLQDQRKSNDLLCAGLTACIISQGGHKVFIPDSILNKKYNLEVYRDPARPFGFTATAKEVIE